MIIGVMTVMLRIPGARSLKEKRMVVRSLKDRIRNTFNVSVAEIGDQEKWQSVTIGIASIGLNKGFVNQGLDTALEFIRTFRGAELVDFSIELL
ncbi:MAG: DUF503 domain-containing protein [Candidatus Omnitrophota bacterium]